ncbi:hypothetical protein [Streptomyces sp. NPDC086023]|uniref:hypothetical protein n=1 Tax=Streptomyces sp. NPDC086023 TaxID=3365746 RepID=UPI0037D3DAE1
MRGSRIMALRVRSGDLVWVQKEWRQVRCVRDDRFATGTAAVVLIFRRGAPWRLRAADVVEVRR